MYKEELKNLCHIFKIAISKGQKNMADLRGRSFLSYLHMKFNYFKIHIFLNMNINKGINLKQRNILSERNKIS